MALGQKQLYAAACGGTSHWRKSEANVICHVNQCECVIVNLHHSIHTDREKVMVIPLACSLCLGCLLLWDRKGGVPAFLWELGEGHSPRVGFSYSWQRGCLTKHHLPNSPTPWGAGTTIPILPMRKLRLSKWNHFPGVTQTEISGQGFKSMTVYEVWGLSLGWFFSHLNPGTEREWRASSLPSLHLLHDPKVMDRVICSCASLLPAISLWLL